MYVMLNDVGMTYNTGLATAITGNSQLANGICRAIWLIKFVICGTELVSQNGLKMALWLTKIFGGSQNGSRKQIPAKKYQLQLLLGGIEEDGELSQSIENLKILRIQPGLTAFLLPSLPLSRYLAPPPPPCLPTTPSLNPTLILHFYLSVPYLFPSLSLSISLSIYPLDR